MAAANPFSPLLDPNQIESDDEEGGADRAPAVGSGGGGALEVRIADGVWRRGRLVERVAGTEPPRWKVQFDDGEARDDIRLGETEAPVRFDAGAYGATVGLRVDGEWRRGKLVELVTGGDEWGVAFDDGEWAEDVRTSSPDVRNVFAGRGATLGEKRDRGDDAGDCEGEELRKRVGTPGQETTPYSEERSHVCETCGKAFSRSKILTVHMLTHSGERPYVCETCGKSFSMSGDLSKHMRTHSGEKPYVCETCGTAFSTSSTLAVHMRTHSGERPHVCETCGKAFTQSSGLSKHMRTHSGEKPYVCKTCGKAFSESGTLTHHMRTHSGEEKPHVCETCGKAYSASGSLAVHMRTHSGEKPYVCETCGKAFSQSNTLVRHMRIHSGEERPHVCETCGKAFSTSNNLVRHIRTHSDGNP
jgi:hypothetical protein